jgi:putative transposase
MEPEFKHLPHVRPFERQPIVFLTVCTAGRHHLLANADTHNSLRAIWEKSSINYGWFVGRYVLMPDHVHLFARAALDAKSLARWVQAWKSLSARLIARSSDRDPPIWQRDYFDRFLRSSESYGQKWNYVWTNPQRAGLVVHPDEWPYGGIITDLSFPS